MSVSGSLQHIFENPSLPENPSLLESLSGIRIKPPVKSIHSFTEIFGELHFKENHHHHHHNNNNEYVSNTTPTTTTQHKNMHLCTEGLGFESSDDVEDRKNNEVNSDERENECYENKKSLGLEDWCEWRTRSSIRVNNKKKNDGVEYPPPISSIGRSGKPCVSFMSYRDNGRFVLKEVRIPIQEFLHAHREDGRLKLHFVQPDQDDDDGDCCNQEEEEDYDEVESVVGEEHMGKENDDESAIDI